MELELSGGVCFEEKAVKRLCGPQQEHRPHLDLAIKEKTGWGVAQWKVLPWHAQCPGLHPYYVMNPYCVINCIN